MPSMSPRASALDAAASCGSRQIDDGSDRMRESEEFLAGESRDVQCQLRGFRRCVGEVHGPQASAHCSDRAPDSGEPVAEKKR